MSMGNSAIEVCRTVQKMYGPIIKFFWDDRCPECKAHIPMTQSDGIATCNQCGSKLELDHFTVRARDVVIILIVTFGAAFVPTLALKIISAVGLLGLWFFKGFKWRKVKYSL